MILCKLTPYSLGDLFMDHHCLLLFFHRKKQVGNDPYGITCQLSFCYVQAGDMLGFVAKAITPIACIVISPLLFFRTSEPRRVNRVSGSRRSPANDYALFIVE